MWTDSETRSIACERIDGSADPLAHHMESSRSLSLLHCHRKERRCKNARERVCQRFCARFIFALLSVIYHSGPEAHIIAPFWVLDKRFSASRQYVRNIFCRQLNSFLFTSHFIFIYPHIHYTNSHINLKKKKTTDSHRCRINANYFTIWIICRFILRSVCCW